MKTSFIQQQKALQRAGIDFVERATSQADVVQLNMPGPRSRRIAKRVHRAGGHVLMFAHTTAEDFKDTLRVPNWMLHIYKRYLSATYRLADVLICPSAYTRDLMIERYGIPAERCVVVSNGVDLAELIMSGAARRTFRERLKAENRLVVGCVGFIIPRKGVSTFVQLAQTHSQHLFMWVGRRLAGAEVPSAREQRKMHVTFVGFVPRSEVPGFYNAMDIFVFPSHEENQGIAVLEAGAMRLPMILRDLPVYRGTWVHGENCLIAHSESEFAQHLERLARDPAERERLGVAARHTAEQHDLTIIGQAYKKIYSQLRAC